jgi:hypothetical protein
LIFILKGFVVSKRIRILLIVLAAVMVTSWVVAQSIPSNLMNIVLPGSIFVRGGPGDEFVPVGALFAGDTVTPVNRSVDDYGYDTAIADSVAAQSHPMEDNAAWICYPEANVTPTPLVGTVSLLCCLSRPKAITFGLWMLKAPISVRAVDILRLRTTSPGGGLNLCRVTAN